MNAPSHRPIHRNPIVKGLGFLTVLTMLLPGCRFDSSGVAPKPRYRCDGEINQYANTTPPKPPPNTVTKNDGKTVAVSWVSFDLSKPSNQLSFYLAPNDWPPDSTLPMIRGSFLLKLPYSDRTVTRPANSSPDNYLEVDVSGRNVDRFWIAFDDRATTVPQWVRDSFKKVTPHRFILSAQKYQDQDYRSVDFKPVMRQVRYQLWEPKWSPTSYVGGLVHLGGNNAAGAQWKWNKVGSQYLVIARVRPTPNLSSKIRKLGDRKLEVSASFKADITQALLQQGKAEAMEAWLREAGNGQYRIAWENGLIDIETDKSKCNELCESIDGNWICRQSSQLSTAPIVVNTWVSSSEADIDAKSSWADVEVVDQGAPQRTKLTGRLEFRIDKSSDVEIGGFDLWGHPVQLSGGPKVDSLTIAQNATIVAQCADAMPRGEFRLCDRYLVPAGDEQGFNAGAVARIRGRALTTILSNTRPMELTINFAAMTYRLHGGPVEGTFEVNGDQLQAKITVNLEGSFTNLAPVAGLAEPVLEWECQDGGQAVVSISAASSFDDLDPTDVVAYQWAEDAGSLTDTVLSNQQVLSTAMSFGEHDLTLIVEDSHGISASKRFAVRVVDSRIDDVTLPADIWEPRQDRSGAVVAVGSASGNDMCSGKVGVESDIPAGNHFPPGFSTVE